VKEAGSDDNAINEVVNGIAKEIHVREGVGMFVMVAVMPEDETLDDEKDENAQEHIGKTV